MRRPRDRRGRLIGQHGFHQRLIRGRQAGWRARRGCREIAAPPRSRGRAQRTRVKGAGDAAEEQHRGEDDRQQHVIVGVPARRPCRRHRVGGEFLLTGGLGRSCCAYSAMRKGDGGAAGLFSGSSFSHASTAGFISGRNRWPKKVSIVWLPSILACIKAMNMDASNVRACIAASEFTAPSRPARDRRVGSSHLGAAPGFRLVRTPGRRGCGQRQDNGVRQLEPRLSLCAFDRIQDRSSNSVASGDRSVVALTAVVPVSPCVHFVQFGEGSHSTNAVTC